MEEKEEEHSKVVQLRKIKSKTSDILFYTFYLTDYSCI